MDVLLAALVQLDHQVIAIDKPGFTVQDRDCRLVAQNPFVLGVAQFLDTRLLLLKQFRPVHLRYLGADAPVKWALRAQMRDMRGTNHDFRRHAAGIHAGTTNNAALDQGDAGATLRGLQGSRHGCAAATNHSDMQVFVTIHSEFLELLGHCHGRRRVACNRGRLESFITTHLLSVSRDFRVEG